MTAEIPVRFKGKIGFKKKTKKHTCDRLAKSGVMVEPTDLQFFAKKTLPCKRKIITFKDVGGQFRYELTWRKISAIFKVKTLSI